MVYNNIPCRNVNWTYYRNAQNGILFSKEISSSHKEKELFWKLIKEMGAVNNCEIVDIYNNYPRVCPGNKWECKAYQKIRNYIKSIYPENELDDEF